MERIERVRAPAERKWAQSALGRGKRDAYLSQRLRQQPQTIIAITMAATTPQQIQHPMDITSLLSFYLVS